MNTAFEIETPVEKLYDLGMINQLCRGNSDLTKKMVQLFIKEIPFSVEEIKQAYKQKDFVTLHKTAHRIKPVLSMYSIVKVEKDIELLENMLNEEKVTPETELKIIRLDNVISLVTKQMNRYIS
jgi:HPt (histidine-containing phosphotransfer) domain-containing protein